MSNTKSNSTSLHPPPQKPHTELEPKIKKLFSLLENKFKGEEIKKELIVVASKCYPFIAIDTKEVIEKIIYYDYKMI